MRILKLTLSFAKLRSTALTFKLNPDRVKVNQQVKYLRQWSFGSKVILRTHKHTQLVKRSTGPLK